MTHPVTANPDTRLHAALAAFNLELAIVFGSMARDTARPDSDLDIAVQGAKPLSTAQRMAMIDALALEFGRPVDLINLRTVSEPLLGRILAEGRRILGPASARGTLLYRHLVEQADFVPLQQRILQGRQDAWLRR